MSQTGFLMVLLSMLAYGVLHSLLASHTVKRLTERLLGAGVQRYYRLFFNFAGVLLLLPVLVLVALLPDQRLYSVSFPWLLINLALIACAVLGLLLGVRQTGALHLLGLAQLVDPQAQEHSRVLVVQGLYRFTRHPLYFFGLLFLWAIPWMSWNLLAFNLASTIYILVGIQFEERKLLRQFGAAYAAYKQTTPMLIPWPFLPR